MSKDLDFYSYNPPDKCPKCSSSNCKKIHENGSSMEYDFGLFYYICNDCGYKENVSIEWSGIEWSGGNDLPKSNWWSITQYPISYFEHLIEMRQNQIERQKKLISTFEKDIKNSIEMIDKLGRK